MTTYSFSVEANTRRNVMYIHQSGKPTAYDFQNLKREFRAGLESLRPGFSIINDQRSLEPYDDEAMEVAKELVELTNEYGASKVIRILPEDLVSKVKLSSTLITGKSRYKTIRVASPQEAEAALDYP